MHYCHWIIVLQCKKYYQKLNIYLVLYYLKVLIDPRGRYDIVSAYPYDSIKINQQTDKFIADLKQLNDILSVQQSVVDLPFQGGAIGYISYDLGERLLGIDSPAQPTLNDMPLLDLGLYDWAIIVDHQQEKVVLFAANTQTSTPKVVDEILGLWHAKTHENQSAVLKSDFSPLITVSEYQQSFTAIHQALSAGRCYQVNLTQAFSCGL